MVVEEWPAIQVWVGEMQPCKEVHLNHFLLFFVEGKNAIKMYSVLVKLCTIYFGAVPF